MLEGFLRVLYEEKKASSFDSVGLETILHFCASVFVCELSLQRIVLMTLW